MCTPLPDIIEYLDSFMVNCSMADPKTCRYGKENTNDAINSQIDNYPLSDTAGVENQFMCTGNAVHSMYDTTLTQIHNQGMYTPIDHSSHKHKPNCECSQLDQWSEMEREIDVYSRRKYGVVCSTPKAHAKPVTGTLPGDTLLGDHHENINDFLAHINSTCDHSDSWIEQSSHDQSMDSTDTDRVENKQPSLMNCSCAVDSVSQNFKHISMDISQRQAATAQQETQLDENRRVQNLVEAGGPSKSSHTDSFWV